MRRMVNEKDIALMEDLNDNNISSKTISQLYIVDNIKEISSDLLNKLKAGDIVLKNTNGQLHAYSVSFKKDDEGICLTYSDASVVETQSYDLVDGVWTYNSEDKTNLINYTAGDNITIEDGVISATDTTYTAGENITIENGVISASGGGKLYEHLIEISENDTNNKYKIIINLINDDNTIITASNINAKLREKGSRVLASGFGMMQGSEGGTIQYNQWGIIYEVQAYDSQPNHLYLYMDVIHDSGTVLTNQRKIEGFKAISSLTITEVVNVEL